MALRTSDPLASIRSEGALLPADFLARLTEPRSQIEGLAPESYHLAGERLGEAASRAWSRLQGVWTAFREARERLPESDSGTSLTRERWLLPLFQELGYGRLLTTRALEVGGKSYAVSHLWNHTPIHLVSFRRELDRAEPGVRGAARSTPHGLVQELLNRSDDHLWAVVSNGLRLRLLRDGSALARQAYVEWDLEYLFENELYPDFLVLWLVCHQSRVEADRPEECWLERWARDAQQQGIRAYEELRKGVQGAIEALGRGFLAYSSQESRNHELRERLEGGALDSAELYRQLLRMVYRLLFLMVAEERGLLHPREADAATVKRYGDFFSLGRLRRLADRSAGSRHPDLLRALRLVFDKLGSDEGSPELGLPALGGFLFSPGAAEALDGCDIDNHHLLTAVRALAFVGQGRTRRPVSFRELGARELGSVYESLLELVPIINARAGTFELRAASGNERKTTGSYYTPEPLIQALLDSALEPVLDEAARKPDYEAAILGLRVCDPACGSGHFLLSAAHRMAHRLATLRSGGVEPSVDALNHARRDVIGHCLYGVDLNPMAVELCKVSLWLEALEPGKPLTFLENRIKQGNSLLGATPALLAAGIPDEAFTAIEGDDKEYVKKYKKANKEERKKRGQLALFDRSLEPWDRLGDVTAAARVVESVPDDTLPAVRRKESEYEKMIRSSSYRFSRLWADAWCAAFVWKKTDEFPYPITEEEFRRLEVTPHNVKPWMEEEIQRLAKQYGFFHWHIEFPDVFRAEAEPEVRGNDPTGWTGGFDIVLGNPPWEMVELKEQEWFSTRDLLIARTSGVKRKQLIAGLEKTNPELFKGFQLEKRRIDATNALLSNSGHYPLCGRGRINTYAVFAELNRQIVSAHGFLGCIVPTGICTDDNTKFFFQDLMDSKLLKALLSFENEAKIFPNVHNETKFCLLSVSGGSHTTSYPDFVFFARAASDLADRERHFSLTGEDIRLLNPVSRTCPTFRGWRDADIVKGIYRQVPVLNDGSTQEQPWQVTFRQGLFNMTSDSAFFLPADELEAEHWTLRWNVYSRGDEVCLPLYEAKMFWHYDHRAATYLGQTQAQENKGVLPPISTAEHADPNVVPISRYWVHEASLRAADPHISTRKYFLVFRDVTGAVLFRTAVFSIIPPYGVGHPAPIVHIEGATGELYSCFLACANSFVLDYCARQSIGGSHLTFSALRQLPFLPPSSYRNCPWDCLQSLQQWITLRVLELTFTAWDLRGFAEDCAYEGPPFRWNEERRFLLRCELDAAFFHLYSIERAHVDYIMDTFPIVRRKDEAAHGEYRTKRVILEIYDEMAEAARTGTPYQTRLDPPPADPRVAHPPRAQEPVTS